MARFGDLSEAEISHLRNLEMPVFAGRPWVTGPPLSQRRIAIVSTAGLHRPGEPTFAPGSGDYRVIPRTFPSGELQMSHISSNFDRSGYQQDVNVVFPIDRLMELEGRGEVGSAADFHYSFMGATQPERMEAPARELADLLKKDRVNGVILCPV